MTFSESLNVGRVAESMIARWLMRRGFCVLPVYEKAEREYKGPQLFSFSGEFVAPDMLAFNTGSKAPAIFVEAKCKTGFTWSRRHERFETGIDLAHHLDYLEASKRTGLPLWVMFLQKGGAVKDAPRDKPDSPRGLFGNEIGVLDGRRSHTYDPDNGGKGGMVYWSPDFPAASPALRLIASYEEIAQEA